MRTDWYIILYNYTTPLSTSAGFFLLFSSVVLTDGNIQLNHFLNCFLFSMIWNFKWKKYLMSISDRRVELQFPYFCIILIYCRLVLYITFFIYVCTYSKKKIFFLASSSNGIYFLLIFSIQIFLYFYSCVIIKTK